MLTTAPHPRCVILKSRYPLLHFIMLKSFESIDSFLSAFREVAPIVAGVAVKDFDEKKILRYKSVSARQKSYRQFSIPKRSGGERQITAPTGMVKAFQSCVAALLAKEALLRPVTQRNADPYYSAMEEELLERINALGIGPQGFGGRTTALGVNIEVMPTHVAGLPIAVNISCHVTRRATAVL